MDITKSLNITKALADESRLMIIDSLREKPKYVEELSERLNLAISTVSFHLKKLESAGLVRSVKEQYYSVYHLNEGLLGFTLSELTSFSSNHRELQDERMLKYKNKVIRTFFRRGRLEKLPAQYKKRVIILTEIMKKFTDKTYTEKEVDNIISVIHDDYVTVRRLLIDEKLMSRKNGIYNINSDYAVTEGQTDIKNKINVKSKMNKSEIKKEYKLKGSPMGVYTIYNPVTGNLFIGSARNVNAIINRHKFELSTHTHKIKELQEAWDKNKDTGMVFEITDFLKPKDEPGWDYREDLSELENLWAEKLTTEKKMPVRLKATEVRR
jgi:DNA-binding HxlR family transcriptional regulator